MTKCLVLGANGFIGSHLVDSLLAAGHEVRAFDRFSTDPTFEQTDRVEILRGDFLNEADLETAIKDIDYVFHFISTTTPATAENDPSIDIETNIRMSVRLFDLCAKNNVKRVLFASTGGAIYGENSDLSVSEDVTPLPVSPYAIGKLSIEHYLRYFKVKRGLDSITFRISNPYGERQPLHSRQGVIPIFLEDILHDKPLTVMGDGSMVRDYIYVKDVADMIVGVFDKKAQYGLYNLGSGTGLSVKEVVAEIEAATNKHASVTRTEVPATFVQRVTLNTSRFTTEFGLKPSVTTHDGLVATYKYIEEETAS